MAPRTPLLALFLLFGTACAGHVEITQPEMPLWPGRIRRFEPVGGPAEIAWVSVSETEAFVRAVGPDGATRELNAPLGGQTVRIEEGETVEMRAPVAGPAMIVAFRAEHDSGVELRTEEFSGGEALEPVVGLQGRVLLDPGRTLTLKVSEAESLVQLTGPAIGELEIEIVAGGGASNRLDSSRGIVFRGPTDLRIRHGAPNPRALVFALVDSGEWTFSIDP